MSATTMTTTTSPFRRPGTMSRRSVLAGMLGLGAATFLDTSFTARPALAAPPKVGELPLPNRLPYSVTASSELADDVFATSEILIGESDRLLPFFNPFSQTTEALVFSGSSLNHLHRDPTQPTGWAYEAFDLQGVFNSVDDVAVTGNDQHVYALITGDPGPDGGDSPYWITWLDNATQWDYGSTDPGIFGQDLPDGSSPLTGGISSEGVPYFYTVSISGATAQLQGWVTTGDGADPLAQMTEDSSVVLSLDVSSSGPVADYIVLYDTNASAPTGYAIVQFADGSLTVYPQQDATFSTSPLVNSGTVGVSQLMWAWATPGSKTGVPGYAIQANIPGTGFGEGTYFCDEQGNVDKVNDSVAPGNAAASVWLAGGQYTVNLLDENYVLQTIQQTGPGAWADPLPLTNGVPASPRPGLTAVYSVPTDPTRNTLFAVGADSSLNVLTLDDSGWTQTQLQQDNTVGVQVECYRLKIAVVDVNGTPVGLASAQLGTDRPVGLWQDIGSTSLVPGTPVTIVADLHGHINVSVPAEELDCAVLTVQALDPNGQPSGPAVPISADYDVQGFLGGSGALPDLGNLSASTLQNAKNPDGSTLFPHLGSSGSPSASDYVTGLNLAIAAGKGTPPATGAPRAVRLEIDGKKTKLSTSMDPKAFGVPSRTEVSLSISHLLHTIGHALRHAMATVKSTVIRWADDVKQWVVDLATDITELTTFAIDSVKDAFHVIGGYFTTLGADIKAGIGWLKREVLGFLSSVGQNATIIEGLVSQAPTALGGLVGGIEKQADGWFVTQEATVTGWFSELSSLVTGTAVGSSQPPTPDPKDTGSAAALGFLAKDIKYLVKVVQDSPGMWLYDKLMEHLPQDTGPDLTGVFDKVYNDLATAFTGFTDLGEQIGRTLWATFQVFTSPDKLTTVALSDLINDLGAVVVDVLKLCDAIVDTVLDFVMAALTVLADYLAYQWSLTSISPVLKLVLDRLGFDPTISLNRLVSLVLALPLTLVRKVRGEALVVPNGSSAEDDKELGQDQVDELFYTLATISQVVWTVVDVVGDLETVAKPAATERPQQEGIIDYFDILCPIAQTVFLLPGWNNQLIWDGLPDALKLRGLIAPAVLGSVTTPTFKIAQKVPFPAGTGTSDADTVQYYEKAPAQPNPLAQYYGPVVSMVGGLANTVMGSMVSERNSTTTATQVEAVLGTVLGDLSNDLAVLTTWWLNDSLDDLPVAVKVGIDGVGGFGAAVVYAISAYED
jgi:hypothetical protein